jgi:serine/threonine-protein kinase RsbW
MRADPDGLVVSNDLPELARVADWIDVWARSRALPAGVIERLHLCAAEAVTNIIMHAYADSASHSISLALRSVAGAAVLEIEDDGRAFDPGERPAPPPIRDIENAPVGGWGIAIMRRFSDEMHYRRTGGHNRLTLVFRVSPAGSIDSARAQATE